MATGAPNFLIFCTDQHPWNWLGCAGHPVQTPNIDKLAEGGVRFERCHTLHPLCMPTRATWFTGQTPRGHGVRCNGIPLNRDEPLMTEALRRTGYATHGIGKVHLNPFFVPKGMDPDELNPTEWPECAALWDNERITTIPAPYYGLESVDYLGASGGLMRSNYTQWLLNREPRGMDLLKEEDSPMLGIPVEEPYPMRLPAELHYTRWMVERSESFFQERARDQKPFFLWWSSPDPHPPYSAPPEFADLYALADMPAPIRREGELAERPPHLQRLFQEGYLCSGRLNPTNLPDEQIQKVRAMVCAMITQLDAAIGDTLKSLEKNGLAENTVIVFMADHGQMLGDHWMLSMPPTHLDSATRVPCIWSAPKGVQGQVSSSLVSHLDFAPTILDYAGVAPLEGRTPPEVEAPAARPALPGRSIRPMIEGRAKSVQDAIHMEMDEDYLGMRIRSLVTDDWFISCYAGEEYGELHHLKEDPQQLHNLWNESACRTTRLELQARLQDRLSQTDKTLPRRMCHA